MLLKRHYDTPVGWIKQVDERGTCLNPPPLSHLEVKHTGAAREQHFSVDLVAAGLAEGWMSIRDGVLTLHAQPEPLRYQILRVPGKYPSTTEPCGYEVIHYYDCILDYAQHATYNARAKGVLHG